MAKLVAVDDIPKGAKLVAVSDEEPSVPFGKRLQNELNGLPRQLGLSVRAGVEGVGDVADFAATPIRAGLNALFPKQVTTSDLVTGNTDTTRYKPGAASWLADQIGLPKPETTTEKTVNSGARAMVPGAGFIKGGQVLANGTNRVVKGVGTVLAENPALQLSSAAAGGGAGEYVKETGGGPTAQLVASIAAGVAAPSAISAARAIPGAVARGAKNAVEYVAPGLSQPQQAPNVTISIENALRDSGITLNQIPANIQAQIRNDVAGAFKIGADLSHDALRRLVDYRLTGAIPRAANLTLDPAAITQQKNLSKLGANSKDVNAQALAQADNANNATLIERLNSFGANTTDDAIGAGQQVIGRLDSMNKHAKGVIDNLYAQARSADGRSALLNNQAFVNSANDALDAALLGGKLPSDVRNLLNGVSEGSIPLTVDVAEQFKTRISALQRASSDPAERLALGHVRNSLDNAPLIDGQGQQAIDAFNRARRANKAWMDKVDRTPALSAVRDGMEPDRFVQQFVIGQGKDSSLRSISELNKLVKGSPETVQTVREQISAHLKNKALNGSADEVGTFSAKAYNKALEAIGERKLSLFFSPAEINQMRAIGRVASYETHQPVGAAVNNSNTAPALMGGMLDRLANSPLLSKIPVLGQTVQPSVQNIVVGRQAANALNVPASLVLPMKKPERSLIGVSPAGLLGFSSE